MEIPQDVQDKLKCSECDELLSCGPVYVLHENGADICGRCSQQPEEKDSINNRSRNGPYEAAASLLAFPCAFAAQGCPEKVSFSLGQPLHEINCEFRPFICPIAPRGSCNWFDSWLRLKEHCDEKHAINVLENPCNPPQPDLTTTNLQTYIISAFHFLFLLHIKVCVASGKLFHSVRMFGDLNLLDKFSYSLEIKGNNKRIIEYGSVIRAGILTIQEPTAICTTINSLLDFLGGNYNESTFTIRIRTSFKFCLNCSKNIGCISGSKFCKECKAKLVKCKFHGNGCSFVDVDSCKCEKHEMYFCEYQTECSLNNCGVNLNGGSIFEHLVSSNSCRRETVKSNVDSIVRVIPNSISIYNYILFSSNIGTLICLYKLSNSTLQLCLRTSLPSYEVKNFKCSIELTDPQTKHALLLTPQIEYNDWDDWSINENMDKLPSWNNIGIDIKINIDKI